HHCANQRTVYTFCMCPGGQVINASSEPGRLVVNGMSCHARNSDNANSALLVGVWPSDFGSDHPLAGVAFQRQWEERAFDLGGRDYRAPAQRVEDFLARRSSSGDLGANSVQPSCLPGVTASNLNACLPDYISAALREALPGCDRKLPGFAMPDALLVGVETRSSSPVRINRDMAFESVTVKGLFPAGEGAGYAGGIISSAVDGIRAAEAVALKSLG
ncbi:MAG: FAD-dependent protein, partial [Planctomycetota bacterium]